MADQGAGAAHAYIRSLIARLQQGAEEIATQGAFMVEVQAKLNATHRPGPMVRTGTLRRGINAFRSRLIRANVYEARTTSSVVYARIQEQGGTIYPKRGMFLVWVTDGIRPDTPQGWRDAEARGIVARARSVRIRPHPYMRPAVNSVAPEYREMAKRKISTIILSR